MIRGENSGEDIDKASRRKEMRSEWSGSRLLGREGWVEGGEEGGNLESCREAFPRKSNLDEVEEYDHNTIRVENSGGDVDKNKNLQSGFKLNPKVSMKTPNQETLLEFKLLHSIKNSDCHNLEMLLEKLHEEEINFTEDLKDLKHRTDGHEKIRDLLYSFFCHQKGQERAKATPRILPGKLKNYWNKLKVHSLPFFYSTYKDFTANWFLDIRNEIQKPVDGIFIPNLKEIKECVLSSLKYLEFPSTSRRQLLQSIIYLQKAVSWYIDEHENMFDRISDANEKQNKIQQTIEKLQPLNRKLVQDEVEERTERRHINHSKNPFHQQEVEKAIFNYFKADDRVKMSDKLYETHKQLDNPLFTPSSSRMSELTEFLITEFHVSTPLRPKAIYDFPINAILFRYRNTSQNGVAIPITWDKIFDLGRFIYLDEELWTWILMYFEIRNRFFSKKHGGMFHLDKSSKLFLSTSGMPFTRCILNWFNFISMRDDILKTSSITPYDCRRFHATRLNNSSDPRIKAYANTACGHGGKKRDNTSVYNAHYNLNQVSRSIDTRLALARIGLRFGYARIL